MATLFEELETPAPTERRTKRKPRRAPDGEAHVCKFDRPTLTRWPGEDFERRTWSCVCGAVRGRA